MDTFRFKYAADNIGSNGTSIDKYIYPQTEDRAFHEAAKYLTSIKAVYLPGSLFQHSCTSNPTRFTCRRRDGNI
jgi:hypothetical protein